MTKIYYDCRQRHINPPYHGGGVRFAQGEDPADFQFLTGVIQELGESLYLDNFVRGSNPPTLFVVGNKGGLTEVLRMN